MFRDFGIFMAKHLAKYYLLNSYENIGLQEYTKRDCLELTAPFLTLYGQTVKGYYRHKIKPFFSQKISSISLPGNSSKR